MAVRKNFQRDPSRETEGSKVVKVKVTL